MTTETTERAQVKLLQLGVVEEISIESPITLITISCLQLTRPLETRSTPAAAPTISSWTAHSESSRVVNDVTLKNFPLPPITTILPMIMDHGVCQLWFVIIPASDPQRQFMPALRSHGFFYFHVFWSLIMKLTALTRDLSSLVMKYRCPIGDLKSQVMKYRPLFGDLSSLVMKYRPLFGDLGSLVMK